MTFEAYMNTVHAQTGKGPRRFCDDALREGARCQSTEPVRFAQWPNRCEGAAK